MLPNTHFFFSLIHRRQTAQRCTTSYSWARLSQVNRLLSCPKEVCRSGVQDNNCFSKTSNVVTATIHTDLPSYFVTNNARERFDYGKLIKGEEEDYEDELNDRRSYRLEREKLAVIPVAFKLIDTPGLNDTSLFDESNIAIMFETLEDIDTINLVVITIANNPFTEGLTDALDTYINLMPTLNPKIVFVHTRIKYSELRPEHSAFAHYMYERQHTLYELMGHNPTPHLLINNDIGSCKTISNCITHNTLRVLLVVAKLKQSIRLAVMSMNKTKKMLEVD